MARNHLAAAAHAFLHRALSVDCPRIVVSSETAERLGLTPGRSTPITIEGLTYRADAEAADAGAAEVPAAAPARG